jgi:uncharacterized protein
MKGDVQKSRIILECIRNYGDLLDIQEFSFLPLYVRIRIIKEGKLLIDKNFDIICQIFLKTIKDYDMFEPHYQTFLDAVKHG